MDTWFFENLALVFGLLLSGISGVSFIAALKSGRMTLQGAIGAFAVFIMGGVITLSQIGLL